MRRANFKKNLAVVLAVWLALLLPAAPVMAGDETSVEAGVQVLPGETLSYGASLAGFRSTMLPAWALGEPDGRGAFIFFNGWISLKLEDSVASAAKLSVWAANRGWWSSVIKISVSSDGRKWKPAGEAKVVSADFLRYDFTGSFGDVSYIMVERSQGPWSWLLLDAVGAKGGDTGKKENNNPKK